MSDTNNTFDPTVQTEYTTTKTNVDTMHTDAGNWNSNPPTLPTLPELPTIGGE